MTRLNSRMDTPNRVRYLIDVPRKIILTNFQCPGDIVMLTAAVRDLHALYPGEFVTDVRTSCPDIWLNNPHLTPLNERDAGVEVIECHYPLIHQSNQRPYHFIHGFMEYIGERLGKRIMPLQFRGDIHLTEEEQCARFSALDELANQPFWIIVAGGKFDFTVKWWSSSRYQAVVDHFAGKIRFAQVGEKDHHHPPLTGVVDLRGRTTLREFILLTHHSSGILCPVTLAMHLAAAVETRNPQFPHRPCVVVAGGREPPHWEAYPFHQFLHSVGMLECCALGGCWRSRVVAIGDGDLKDHPLNLCTKVVEDLPGCMDMISADDVIRCIEKFDSHVASVAGQAECKYALTAVFA
jgi:ADP-heptose:LPS heptosyltransferase